jgi:lipocalin-like protein
MASRSKIFAVAALVFGLLSGEAVGQKSLKEQLIGTWILVSVDNVKPDGSRTELFGSNPKGILIYTTDGHFATVSSRADLPKFAANRRDQGTPEENRAVVQGSIAYFGTYSVNEADMVVTAKVEASTFAGMVGDPDQKRVITLITEDGLKLSNPASTTGGKLELVWRRAK